MWRQGSLIITLPPSWWSGLGCRSDPGGSMDPDYAVGCVRGVMAVSSLHPRPLGGHVQELVELALCLLQLCTNALCLDFEILQV